MQKKIKNKKKIRKRKKKQKEKEKKIEKEREKKHTDYHPIFILCSFYVFVIFHLIV